MAYPPASPEHSQATPRDLMTTRCQYAPQLKIHEPLSLTEARRLHRKYAKRKLSAYCTKLFRHHYGFAVKIAMRYVRPEFPADEAISAAVRGLLEALRRYNPRKGAFTTFSYWWIIKHVLNEKAFSVDIVKLPVGLVRLSRKAQRLRIEYGNDDETIAAELGVDVDELEAIEELHQYSRTVEMDPHDGPGGSPHTAIDSAPNPREALEESERMSEQELMRIDLRDALAQLSPQERDIVLARFVEDPPSFNTLGKKYRVSGEAIRVIYLRAMEKVKSYCGGTD